MTEHATSLNWKNLKSEIETHGKKEPLQASLGEKAR